MDSKTQAPGSTDLRTKLDTLLESSGDVNQLKELLRRRLSESGWTDEIRLNCNQILKKRGVENVELDTLVSDLTKIGREKIPDSIKKELLEKINLAVQKHMDSAGGGGTGGGSN